MDGNGVGSRERVIGAVVLAIGALIGLYVNIPWVTEKQWLQRNQSVDHEIATVREELSQHREWLRNLDATQQRVKERLRMFGGDQAR